MIRNTHNASTFRPYDPAAAIGDTAPNDPVQPQPQVGSGGKCGGFGKVLLVVIAVAVSAWTYGALTGGTGFLGQIGSGLSSALGSTGGAAAAGAISGAAGSIASQGVGVATGIQDQFSWNQVGLAAVSAGISRGISDKFGPVKTWKGAAIRGAATSAMTQGIGVATGMQEEFSWAGVAAAGVGAGIGFAVSDSEFVRGIGSAMARSAIVGTASAIGNAATRSLIEGSDFGDNVIAALPDVIGQTIGDAIAGETSISIEKAKQANLVVTAEQAASPADGSITASNGVTSGSETVEIDDGAPLATEKAFMRQLQARDIRYRQNED